MQNKLKVVVDAKATLAESPCWDPNNKCLYWVDILQKNLHQYSLKTKENRTFKFNKYLSSVAVRKSGGLILTLEDGFYFYNTKNDELMLLQYTESNQPNNRFNDGKCDPGGRFWAGTMDKNAEKYKGSLYCMNNIFKVDKVLSDLSIPNGIAWDIKKKKMYFIDSPSRQILVFDYDMGSGDIRNKRVAVTISEGQGLPDGMTIDEEGMIWVAHFGGGKVSRWDPKYGRCLQNIYIPTSNVTSCVFGGEEMKDLYITTARQDLAKDELEREPLAGNIFCIKTNFKGAPTYQFEG
ncbi:SMP-30/gluconolactonase/LRE family protein [Virgibacillus dakarensis]|uniref:SMP-30/gluconolactonase/LRE family protein n=1 Tax=Virgibacillus dakarensis TaxID=1917889 RepID=UPI000B437F82|nr:SMP-30/gluconolactonase/LRE family protein [Virgibacillus dakarensis]